MHRLVIGAIGSAGVDSKVEPSPEASPMPVVVSKENFNESSAPTGMVAGAGRETVDEILITTIEGIITTRWEADGTLKTT